MRRKEVTKDERKICESRCFCAKLSSSRRFDGQGAQITSARRQISRATWNQRARDGCLVVRWPAVTFCGVWWRIVWWLGMDGGWGMGMMESTGAGSGKRKTAWRKQWAREAIATAVLYGGQRVGCRCQSWKTRSRRANESPQAISAQSSDAQASMGDGGSAWVLSQRS